MLTDTKVRAAKPVEALQPDRRRSPVPAGCTEWWQAVLLADTRVRCDETYALICEDRNPNIAMEFNIEANLEASCQTL